MRRPRSHVERADKDLKAFEKVWLDPGESARVRLLLPEQSLRHWDETEGRWAVERGEAAILVGASSRDIRLSATTNL